MQALYYCNATYLLRRVYRGLKALNRNDSDSLAINVAVKPAFETNQVEPRQKREALKIVDTDILVTSLAKWEKRKTLTGIQLNDGQIKAMKLALCNKFQLIQGPPGM